tara:strand:+ start:7279 stop:7644 length:366 start_codon:yes stop_codon:yes gene_type:complete
MSDHNYSETRVIGFKRICAFFALGPFILPVFTLYSAGHWLERKGWDVGWRRVVITPLVVAFSIINTIHNWTVCTILFWELPREFHTTSRLKRLKNHPDPSKRELADLLGGFLNSQDPNHYR